MLTLGFVSAILPDLNLEEVLAFAASNGFACVELMCWPQGKAERRYAGITHIDVAGFTKADAARIKDLSAKYGVAISGLGYYPNPLAPDKAEAAVYVKHLQLVIKAASLLGVGIVNTFTGRDYTQTVDENWPRFLKTWKPLIQYAETHNVKIGIENSLVGAFRGGERRDFILFPQKAQLIHGDGSVKNRSGASVVLSSTDAHQVEPIKGQCIDSIRHFR